MGTPNSSLSVLEQVAGAPQENEQQSTGSSLSVLRQVSDNPPISMVGPKGENVQVPQDQVVSMRQKNFAVTPDNPEAQKMVTADGKVAYVLPGEVRNFEDLGATKILPDGRFLVKNLRSDNSEFPDYIPDVRTRAVSVGKALGPAQMHESVKAEQAYWTSKEGLKDEAKGLANVALVDGGTAAVLGAAPAVSAVRIAVPTAINTGALIAATPVGQAIIKKGAAYVLGTVGGGALAKLGWNLGTKWFGK